MTQQWQKKSKVLRKQRHLLTKNRKTNCCQNESIKCGVWLKSPPTQQTPPTIISSAYKLNKQVEQSGEYISIKYMFTASNQYRLLTTVCDISCVGGDFKLYSVEVTVYTNYKATSRTKCFKWLSSGIKQFLRIIHETFAKTFGYLQ